MSLRDSATAASAGVDQASGLAGRMASNMFRYTGLAGLTERQQIAATRSGQVWLASLLDDVADGTKRKQSALFLLRELGMDEADAMGVATWLRRGDGMPNTAALLGDGREATSYRTAVARFVREAVQNPQAVDKPMMAQHPLGRLVYGITSFNYAFGRNIVMRTFKVAGEAAAGENYTMADRARLLGALPAFMLLGAAQYGVSELREQVMNWQQRQERDDFTNTVLNLDRTGMFMAASPLVHQVAGAKYGGSPLALLTGPYLASYAQDIEKMTTALLPVEWGGANSSNTNRAEHAAVRAAYRAILTPAVVAGLSMAPGGSALQAAYGIGMVAVAMPGLSYESADALVGERPSAARTGGRDGHGPRSTRLPRLPPTRN